MDTAPASASAKDLLERSTPRERPSIGVPSIPARSDPDRKPASVPSIPVDSETAAALSPQPAPLQPAPQSAPPPPQRPAATPQPATTPKPAPPQSASPPPLAGEESFTPAVREKLKGYVYLLVDPRTGRPFHVGRGRNDCCFDHLRAARTDGTAARPGAAAEDDFPALDRIRRIESAGRPVRVEILRYGLSSDEAAVVATAAHELLGLPGEPPAGIQRGSAVEIQSRLTKRAKFKRSHQVVLLRVGPVGTPATYEHARHGWRIGRRWVDVEASRSPRWAAVVVGEVVESVYRIDRWEPWHPGGGESAPGGTGARPQERYSFVGTRDTELERRYVGKSAVPYLGKGLPGSVAYVWCGPHWVNTAG